MVVASPIFAQGHVLGVNQWIHHWTRLKSNRWPSKHTFLSLSLSSVKRAFLLACVRRSWRGGAGWGGAMLTFLVLLPLHVATLHRCLVVLLRCIHEGVGWGGHGNKEQRSSPLCEVLAVEICESAYPSPAKKQLQGWSPCFEKKETACQYASMKWIQNPHETRILPNSRARIWHNSASRNVDYG